MDDTGSFASNTEEAIQINREILAKFREAGLFCKPSKCDFHKDQVELLGVTVNAQGLGLEDKKVTAVRDWPIP
jgi:ABC-type uncharacterized transport system substrate-binding protein